MHIVLGLLMGFVVARFTAGDKAGKPGRGRSLKIAFKGFVIHMHHWIWSGVILFVSLNLEIKNHLAIGILLGVIAQGLTYSDFYKIIYKKKKSDLGKE